jgi:hypothetical protein
MMLRWWLLLLVACDAGGKPKPAPAPPLAPSPGAKPVPAPPPVDAQAAVIASRHKHSIRTVDLTKPDLGAITLPKHGIVLKTWGLGGDDTLVLDSDVGVIRQISNLMGKGHADHRLIVAPARVKATMATAYAAWDEEPNGKMPEATDVREDLYILDDDEAFYLSGYPIGAYGKQGRPLAEKALTAMFALAPDR